MGVGVEAGAGPHDVVVADQEQAVVGVFGIVVVAETEAVMRVEPAGAGLEAAVSLADLEERVEQISQDWNSDNAQAAPSAEQSQAKKKVNP